MIKKIRIIPISFVYIIIILFGCGKEEVSVVSGELKPIILNEQGQKLVSSSNFFSFEIFKTIQASEPSGKNLMISPLSISYALGMLYNGANGNTKDEIRKMLGFSNLSDEQVNSNFQSLTKALTSIDEKVNVSIANSIWYRKDFTVLADFLNTNQTYFGAEIQSLNFGDPNSLLIINKWVSDKTQQKIPEILKEIPAEAVMYLINAIYFKGIWKYKFKKEETQLGSFYSDDKCKCYLQVPTMKQEGDFKTMSNSTFSALELPYGQGNFSMVVILPNYDKTIGNVMAGFDATQWQNLNASLMPVKGLKIKLPRFKFEYEKSLVKSLQTLGMNDAFANGIADLSKINALSKLFVSEVKHKSFIEVNEDGTEAAAVTSIELTITSIILNEFVVNRPFIFVIKENSTGAILFMGQVYNPAN